MIYPKVRLELGRSARVGRDVMQAIRQHWPGGFNDKSDIVFRWGQNTPLPGNQTTVIFDCGYFRRERALADAMHFRVSINEYHPTRLPAASPDRWRTLNIEIENLYKPDGHIVLVGRGMKARVKQGGKAPDWERAALARLRAAYPDSKIIYRPKKMPSERLEGAVTDAISPIRDVCCGAALVYSHSSNVANEAILYGIPAVAVGGPAADVCSQDIPARSLSDPARLDYLHRLAYWQWSVNEIRRGLMWPWLMAQVERGH